MKVNGIIRKKQYQLHVKFGTYVSDVSSNSRFDLISVALLIGPDEQDNKK